MTELSQTELRRAMRLTADAGALLLASGGEVSRVQQTMEIMARCLHIEDFHVYVLTNGIFSSTSLGNVSEVRHVPAVSIHLDRVEEVNALSRRLAQGELDLDSAEAALAAIPSMPAYGPRRQLLANAVGSACFGYLFGGGPAEMAAAFAAGLVETVCQQLFARHRISRLFTDISAALGGSLLVLLVRLLVYPSLNPNSAIIGALMVLTPGVAFTMGIRDLINADYLSGSIRLLSALLVAGCLAVGVAAAWLVYGALRGVLV